MTAIKFGRYPDCQLELAHGVVRAIGIGNGTNEIAAQSSEHLCGASMHRLDSFNCMMPVFALGQNQTHRAHDRDMPAWASHRCRPSDYPARSNDRGSERFRHPVCQNFHGAEADLPHAGEGEILADVA